MNSWNQTRKNYIKWLTNNDLKEEFLNRIKYKDFSLWWATTLVDKDNINEDKWYYDLNDVLNKKNIEKRGLNFFYLFYKFFKKFVKSILFNIIIKIFIRKKNNFKKIENCFFTFGLDLVEMKRYCIDRQYGKASFTNKNKNVYLINLNEGIGLIKNIFAFKRKIKKIPCEYFITDHYISILDIIKIYFLTLKEFIKLILILNKKNFFLINNKDCTYPLKNKLVDSFFGNIQNALINGVSTGQFIEKNQCKNLISYLEFYPLSRSIYHFSKKNDPKIKLISINHANYSNDNLFFNFEKNEFITGRNNESASPKPDIFFCQGEKYFFRLKKIFPKEKIFLIGSLKIELDPYKKKINKNIFKKINFKPNNDKILTIFPSLNDYKPFVEILNNSDLSSFKIILKPHPIIQKITTEYFRRKFIHKFMILNEFSPRDLINTSNYIIFGDSSIGLEASLKNKNVFRVYHKKFIPTFNRDNEIPTATSKKEVNNFLRRKKIKQRSSYIEKKYFYKYDQNVSKRFYSVLSRIRG